MEEVSYYEICDELYKYERTLERVRKEYTQIAFRMTEFGFNHFGNIGNFALLDFIIEIAQEYKVLRSEKDSSLYEYLVSIGITPKSDKETNEYAIELIKELVELKNILQKAYYDKGD